MKHEEKKEYCMPEMTVLEFVQEGNLLCGSPGDPSCSADDSDDNIGSIFCGGTGDSCKNEDD